MLFVLQHSPCRLWEYDPSVRPAGITDAADDDDLHATSDDNMGRRISQGSVSSAESRAPSIIASPRGGSSDIGSDGRQSLTKPSGVVLTAAAAGLAGAAGGAVLSPAAAAIGPDGWLWHCENPFKVNDTAAVDFAALLLRCCDQDALGHARVAVVARRWLDFSHRACSCTYQCVP
jgi:hypothetical protein